MSVQQSVSSSVSKRRQFVIQRPPRQIFVLLAFFIISLALYVFLALVAPPLDDPIRSFMAVWALCFACYFIVSIWIIMTKPSEGRWRWVELGIIFAGACIFRFMLLPLPLGLSRDAWRYLWDAHLIVHGYNPYLYAPLDKALIPLHYSVFNECPYREFPTKYPPGAELFFVLGYLLMPASLTGLKGLFVLCDLITCGALTLLLKHKGLDLRRVAIYAWSPLPIVEFAIQGHLDAIAIAFTVVAVLCAVSSRPVLRILAGVLIGLATLSKLYPIILLIALVRRRDWGLLIACAITITLGYLPFLLTAQGQFQAVLLSFAGQSKEHLGAMQNELPKLGLLLGIRTGTMLTAINILVVVITGTTLLTVLVQRLRGRMSVEMAIFILTALVLAVYAHIFPWYAAAFLPWIALLVEPIWTPKGFNAKALAIVMVWYFTCTVVLSYIPGLRRYFTSVNWSIYHAVTFVVVLSGLAVAAITILVRRIRMDKRLKHRLIGS